MTTAIETVYTNRNNVISLTLSEDGVPVADHTQFNRAILELGIDGEFSSNVITSVDSNTEPTYFDFTQTDKIVLKLGEAGLPRGRFWARLIVFTASAPLGVVWEPPIEIRVE